MAWTYYILFVLNQEMFTFARRIYKNEKLKICSTSKLSFFASFLFLSFSHFKRATTIVIYYNIYWNLMKPNRLIKAARTILKLKNKRTKNWSKEMNAKTKAKRKQNLQILVLPMINSTTVNVSHRFLQRLVEFFPISNFVYLKKKYRLSWCV